MRHLRLPLNVRTRCGLIAAEHRTTGAGPLCPECRKAKDAWTPQRSIIYHDQPARYCWDFTPAGGSAASMGKAARL